VRAPSDDGTGASGECYIIDQGDNSTPIKIYVTSTLESFDQFKVGDSVIIANAPTLGGNYYITVVETFGTLADGAVLTTSRISGGTFILEGA